MISEAARRYVDSQLIEDQAAIEKWAGVDDDEFKARIGPAITAIQAAISKMPSKLKIVGMAFAAGSFGGAVGNGAVDEILPKILAVVSTW